MNRWTIAGLIILVTTAGCGVHSEGGNEVSFGGNVTTENGMFHLEGEIDFEQGPAPDHNYSNISIVLYDANKREIKSVDVGRMSTEPRWGATERLINVTSDTVPTYVVVESPDFWSKGEIEVVSLWIHDDIYHRYARTGPDDDKFPCEVSGQQVTAPHCD